MTLEMDFVVPPRSWAEIGDIANTLRHTLGLANEPYFPVIEVIEQVLDQRLSIVRLDVGDFDEMDGAEGLTCPSGEFIMLREDVYMKACIGEPRSRFTTAHEVGHLALHTNIPMARASRGDNVPIYRRAEPQANQFAAELLMPARFINNADSENCLMDRFGVSFSAAGNRLRCLRKRGIIR